MRLTEDQHLSALERGIRSILVTGNHQEAAKAAGCNLQTWHQWRKTEEYRTLFELRRQQAAVVSMEKIGTLFHQALGVFHEAMDETQPMDVRLKAATAVVSLAKKNDPAATGPVIEAMSRSVTGGDAAAELRRRRSGQPLVDAAALRPPAKEGEE